VTNYYSDIRESIRTGDLIAFRPSSFIGRIITHVTGGSWSHVAIAIWLDERLFILEAKEFRGVQIRAMSEVGDFDWIPILKPPFSQEMRNYSMSRLGKPYSYADALRAGFGLKFNKKNGDICSEYASDIYRKFLKTLTPIPPSPTPSKLVEFMINIGFGLKHIKNK